MGRRASFIEDSDDVEKDIRKVSRFDPEANVRVNIAWVGLELYVHCLHIKHAAWRREWFKKTTCSDMEL